MSQSVEAPTAANNTAVTAYISRIEPKISLNPRSVSEYLNELRGFLQGIGADEPPTLPLEKLFLYRVPAMKPDGCSRIDGVLDDEPYDLRVMLGVAPEKAKTHPETRRLYVLNCLVEKLVGDIGVNWLGFYERHKVGNGHALVKLAYRGAESRAEFPLTKEFARQSNNSMVGLTGKSVLINDIESYLWEQGGPYYQCDSKVLSEVCLPVFSADGREIVGIVDAESFEREKFGEREFARLAATAIVLGELLQAS